MTKKRRDRIPGLLEPFEVDVLPGKEAIERWHAERAGAVWGDYDLVWKMTPEHLAAIQSGGGLVVCIDSETGGQLMLCLQKEVLDES